MCRTKEGGSSSKFYGMHIPSICPFLQQRKEDGEIVQFNAYSQIHVASLNLL